MNWFITVLTATLLASPTQIERAAHDILFQVNQAHLDAIQTTRTAPPRASRNLAIMHQVMDFASNGMLAHRCEGDREGKISAFVEGGVYVLRKIYPSLVFDSLLDLIPRPDSDCVAYGAVIGTQIANKTLAARDGDGSDAVVAYEILVQDGHWQKTHPGYQEPLLPHWGSVKTFGISSASNYVEKSIPALDSAEYLNAYSEVKNIGAQNSTTRTPEQSKIAHYWESGAGTYTPPGQWNYIAQSIIKSKDLSIEQALKLFRQLNEAMADAGIVCWTNKYKLNFWRPITAIWKEDPTWRPLLTTPPFPEFTSGHSTFSSAGVTILTHYFGDDVSFEVPYFGKVIAYKSLSQALSDAGKSRIYGGIHFEHANERGQAHGKAIANELLHIQK